MAADNSSMGRLLRAVGFYATAHDFDAGRIDKTEVIRRLRRDTKRVRQETALDRMVLADQLSRRDRPS